MNSAVNQDDARTESGDQANTALTTNPDAQQLLDKIASAPTGAYGNKIKHKAVAAHSSPFEAITSAIKQQDLTALDAPSSLGGLWDKIPDRVNGAVINKAFICSGIECMLAVLIRNEKITAAPDNSAERAVAYETVLNALAYIGHKFEQAHQRDHINDTQLYQMMEILGSAGENCFLAYQDAVCLISSQYAEVLDLCYVGFSNTKPKLENELDAVYLKSCNIVAQKLFGEFYPLVILDREYAPGTDTAMRGHFRLHFFEHLAQYFNIPVVSAKLPDTAIENEDKLNEMEVNFFHSTNQSNKLTDLLIQNMQVLFNNRCEQDSQTRDALLGWLKNKLAYPKEFDELLPEKIFQGYSFKLQDKFSEYLFQSFGYLQPYRPTMRERNRIVARLGNVEKFKLHVSTENRFMSCIMGDAYWFRHNTNEFSKLIENTFTQHDQAALKLLLQQGLNPKAKVFSSLSAGEDTEYGNVPLLNLAVVSGDVHMARILLDKGANPTDADQTLRVAQGDRDLDLNLMHKGRTALDIAVNHNHTPIVDLLLGWGVKTSKIIPALEHTKESYLDLSIRKEYTNLTHLLLERRPKSTIKITNFLKLKDWLAENPSNQASIQHVTLSSDMAEDDVNALRTLVFEANDSERLSQWLSQGLDYNAMIPLALTIQEYTYKGSVPLLNLAAAYGRVDMVRQLLDAGANINCVDGTNLCGWCDDDINTMCAYRTPLHIAVNQNHIDMVRLLLARGADTSLTVERSDQGWESALDIAIRKGLTDIIDRLLTDILSKDGVALVKLSHWGMLQQAAEANDSLKARLKLIRISPQPDYNDAEILRQAVFENNDFERLSEYLFLGLPIDAMIDHRMEVDGKEWLGTIPLLNLAAAYNCEEMVRLLLESGADANCRDQCNVMGYGDDDISVMLENRTPLHIAVNQNNPNIVRLLLAHGASRDCHVNSGEERLETPLDIARRKQCTQMIELLMDTHSDLFLSDSLSTHISL